jgi:hypothetical protein
VSQTPDEPIGEILGRTETTIEEIRRDQRARNERVDQQLLSAAREIADTASVTAALAHEVRDRLGELLTVTEANTTHIDALRLILQQHIEHHDGNGHS